MGYKCFMLTPSGFKRRSLRRYTHGKVCPLHPGDYSYHDATVFYDDVEEEKDDPIDKELLLFPTACACGYEFTDEDEKQIFKESLWNRDDGGPRTSLREAPVGAMWDATWLHYPGMQGPDGMALVVVTPGGHWHIDSRCANCTLPNDNVHKCWVRHGTPPNIHVDKNGVTCSAGGGSILAGKWHGFLRNGELVEA